MGKMLCCMIKSKHKAKVTYNDHTEKFAQYSDVSADK